MTTLRTGWVDATAGISGDMLLGACLDAGAPLAAVHDALGGLALPEPVDVRAEDVRRGALGATRAVVVTGESRHRRTLPDLLALLAPLPPRIAGPAERVFRALAEAEARVHRMPVDEVHFHEVGALDSIADVVGVVAALDALALDRLVCSPVALGGGRADTDHGSIPIPGPAVLELLRAHDAPGFGGPVETELATPTGVALVAVLADEFGPMPPVRPDHVGIGAGTREPPGHLNVTRLVVGSAEPASADPPDDPVVQLEANVDDLDPRLWPAALEALLAAGALDAWLAPTLMKKGRPGHTLCVLSPPHLVPEVERVVFTHTTTIGVRRHRVDRTVLPREVVQVRVHGEPVEVKVSRLDGAAVTATPEYDDVVRAAARLSLPVRAVLDAARAAAETRP